MSVCEWCSSRWRMAAVSQVVCAACGAKSPRSTCSSCNRSYYCDRICQTNHWSLHKKSCGDQAPRMDPALDPWDSGDLFLSNLLAARARGAPKVTKGSLLPPHIAMQNFRMCIAQNPEWRNKKPGQYLLQQTMAPSMYHHRIDTDLLSLKPISMKEAVEKVNYIHTGRVMFATVPPEMSAFITSAVNIPLCDDEGSLMILNAYNLAPPGHLADAAAMFTPGATVVIFQPYCKFARDDPQNPVNMRSDHPHGVRVFPNRAALEQHMRELKAEARAKANDEEKTDVSATATPASTSLSPKACKDAGNALMQAGKFREAEEAYTRGLSQETPTSAMYVALQANRAEARLRFFDWRGALSDCQAVLAQDKGHVKCRSRAMRALLALQRPSEALLIAKDSDVDAPQLQQYTEEALRAEKEQKGEYDEPAMQEEALRLAEKAAAASGGPRWRSEATLVHKTRNGVGVRLSPHHAEFVASELIELAEYQGKGRGVRARRDIPAGTLLVVARALAVSSFEADTHVSIDAYGSSMKGTLTAFLLSAVAHNPKPNALAQLYMLDGGHRFPPSTPMTSLASAIDTDITTAEPLDLARVYAIESANSFGNAPSPWVTAQHPEQLLTGLDTDPGRLLSGIWVLPSFFNHSCSPDAFYYKIGDFLFVRTARAVKAGDEICVAYVPSTMPFLERQDIFSRWNGSGEAFTCRCERCEFMRAHPECLRVEQCFDRVTAKATKLKSKGSDTDAGVALSCLPTAEIQEAARALSKFDLVHQSALAALLDLEVAIKASQGDYEAVFKMDSQSHRIKARIGGAPGAILVSSLRLVSYALGGLHRPEEAKAQLQWARQHIYPFLPLDLWLSIVLHHCGNHAQLRSFIQKTAKKDLN